MPNEGNRLYFLSVIPPQPLRDDIQELKHYVRDTYHSSHSLNAPPHITLLAPFHMLSDKEAEFSNILNNFIRKFSPFEITFNNFSNFPPRVIFIDVVKSEELVKIQQELENLARNEQDLFKYNYHERTYHPHLTIAFKDLTKRDFHRAWKEFQDREFQSKFTANTISLLKHDGKEWDVIKDFELSSK